MLAHREDIAPNRGHEPTRMCALTRARAPQRALLRLALGPEGEPYVDLIGRAPGRGVYIKCEPEVFRRAMSPKGLGRVFRGRAKALEPAAVEAALEDTIRRLEARIVEMVGIARRAGLLELGMDPALRALEAAGGLLLLAEDLGAASARKIRAAAERAPGIRVIHVATKERLGSMLGRVEVGVVAIRPSRHADRMASEADRWRALRGDDAASPEIPLTDPGHPEQSVGGADGGEHGAAGEVK